MGLAAKGRRRIDNFSAEIAVQAALTGHKVLTTFHTEDSIGGLVRLLNMNIEAFLMKRLK